MKYLAIFVVVLICGTLEAAAFVSFLFHSVIHIEDESRITEAMEIIQTNAMHIDSTDEFRHTQSIHNVGILCYSMSNRIVCSRPFVTDLTALRRMCVPSGWNILIS